MTNLLDTNYLQEFRKREARRKFWKGAGTVIAVIAVTAVILLITQEVF
ncbi:hypothetical protein [uncultured Phascolarctobacterium sp.]|nr:hypothetical protein [uncultured Phascolarctobacterium sp.]